MFCTSCVVCARADAKKNCARCGTVYCSPHCQQEHWTTGHKKKCKKIQRAGGAEQFYADATAKYYADTAVLSCAAEGVPQDAECFICKSSIEGKGIVRGCACRGTMGLAHVACLVRQAEASVNYYEEWHQGVGHNKWHKCFDCGQHFHGIVQLALGWACWKTYLGRPEASFDRCNALGTIGGALRLNACFDDALLVYEAHLAVLQRHYPNEDKFMLAVKNNLASCCSNMGLHDRAVRLQREIHTRGVALYGATEENVLLRSGCLGISLHASGRFVEARTFLREQIPLIRTYFGPDHDHTLKATQTLAASLNDDPASTRESRLEAETILQDVVERRFRVYGHAHPLAQESAGALVKVRANLDRAA